VNVALSWLMRSDSSRTLLDWAAAKTAAEYEPVGVADILSNTETRYVFGQAAKDYQPASRDWVVLLQRKRP